ncbi:fructosamine kinase family protein [Gleimia europaea]|uniref:Fructosamine kinase n=1 Tax=Gleimia europaea ACS-120-V-Col10b TaxID=883069 RepID=A0A9W5RFQ4_9ACTO|nr:fructosamine kinase family protein [Gleimia europaea]EPD31441.1 hypothetical protein HMPREF9238_01215 [Gleimia europaea ACS-120-V-Col10b]
MSVCRKNDVFIKTDLTNPASPQVEALGLRWLSEAMEFGGAHVAPVVSVKDGEISTRAIQNGSVTQEAAFQFGRALALTHAQGADYYGQAPLGWEGRGWMGKSNLSFTRPGEYSAWGDFFAQERILPYLPGATDNGSIPRGYVRVVDQVCERLRDGDFDAREPALVKTPASRIHGDLWSGNVLWSPADLLDWAPAKAGLGTTRQELPDTVGVLIDPAACGGHAEKDLADFSMFGQKHSGDVYAGYQAESKLESGWQERISLHQLHMLMIHAELFGGSYGDQVISVCKRYA